MKRLTMWIDDGENRQAIPDPEIRSNGHGKCCNKLAEYEDLEEQGLLLRLPCKVGDTIYVIENSISKMRRIISDYEVVFYSLDFSKNYIYCTHHYGEEESESRTILIEEIGKTAFLTLAEAESKLKEMEEKS